MRSNLDDIRENVAALCAGYGEEYWRKLDAEKGYPTDFVKEMTRAGFLGCLIPETYGGAGLGLIEACAILEEISRRGAHAGACHAQMYVMGSLLRHGSKMQKEIYLPKIASGELRLQSFGVTEPSTGTDTTKLKTRAEPKNGKWAINGQKVWISRVEHSDLMVLLARTTPLEEVKRKSHGLSAFIVDLREAIGNGLEVQPIEAMINHHACELFFDNLEIPKENLLGTLDEGFSVILDGMNAERILIAAECVGDARYFTDHACAYANERVDAKLEAAALMVEKAAHLFDAGETCGAEANMAKLLAAEASWEAGDTCMQTLGGFAFSKEYNIERKFRETRLYQTAPISTNLILSYIAEHVLGMPRSF